MSDITVTAAKVGLVDPIKADVESKIAAEAITKGQAVYYTTAGKAGVADANDSGKEQFRGIALNGVAAGQPVDVCQEGELEGFSVSALDADVLLYLSDTAGALADGVGTMTVACARVVARSDKDLTQVIRVFVQWEADWA